VKALHQRASLGLYDKGYKWFEPQKGVATVPSKKKTPQTPALKTPREGASLGLFNKRRKWLEPQEVMVGQDGEARNPGPPYLPMSSEYPAERYRL
jgi:hypothetical protein